MIERLNQALEGRYSVERELGEGGMATVFLAEDLKHKRKVAIKVLKPELAAVVGGERFLAEIETTAALQHPHILPLFDSGDANGFLFYVMPYVAGESLRERLAREKQLAVDGAVAIAAKVAAALQEAHERGVIHRDIKPANILLSKGEPLVADFGVALALSAAGGGRLTETGMSVGTPHYMSPEQASADREVDARSDIYALASVLYEMLAGDPPHTGSTAQAVLMRILTEEPRPLGEVRGAVPAHVAHATSKGLEKLPADRFATAADFAAALSDERFRHRTPDEGGSAGAVGRRGGGWTRDGRTWGLVAANVVLLAVFGWSLARSGSPPTGTTPDRGPVHRYVVSDSQRASSGSIGFSRSGDLAYAVVVDGTSRIRLRRSSDTAAVDLPGTEGGGAPVFSPNEDWIVFSTHRSGLAKIQLGTGTVVPILSAGSMAGVVQPSQWREEGTIVFAAQPGGIYRMPEVGGDPELLHEAAAPTYAHVLPDDRTLVYTDLSDWGGARLVAVDLDTRDTTTLVANGGKSAWSPSGHILHGHRSGAIYALPFDLDRAEPRGPSVPVQESVFTIGNVSYFEMSSSGTLMYFPRGTSPVDLEQSTYAWFDTSGALSQLPVPPVAHAHARVSPDGRTVAYTRNGQIHLFDIELGTDRRVTFDAVDHHHPVWSPGGTRLAFSAEREGGRGGRDVWVLDLDGSTDVEWLTGTDGHDAPGDWLEDGTLLFSRWEGEGDPGDIWSSGDGSFGLWVADTDEPGADPTPLLENEWNQAGANVSPDGQWLAYVSGRTGETHLMVTDFPALARRWQVSDRASLLQRPLWSRDGSLVYFPDGTGDALRAAELELEPDFRVLGHRVAIESFYSVLRDREPDGERLLVSRAVGTDALSRNDRMVVAVNWLTELRERLGEGR